MFRLRRGSRSNSKANFMTILKKINRKPIIDLTGPEGNAFYLLGVAQRLSLAFGMDGKAIITRMQESDYENLIRVFDEEFGEFIDLVK